MKRRELVIVGASTAIAHGVVTNLGCGAQETGSRSAVPHSGGESPLAAPSDAMKQLAAAAGECISAGEACLSHCLRLLQAGDTSMADCSKAVHQMLAICRAVPPLATSSSAHLGGLAALCRDVCGECQAACAPHAGHHDECRACMEACQVTGGAAAALAT